MDLEERIRTYTNLAKKIDELELEKKALGAAILQQMQGKTMKVAEYLVRRYTRLSIKLSLEEARTFDAVKMEETVDKDKIKAMYELGMLKQGVSEVPYLRISSQTKMDFKPNS